MRQWLLALPKRLRWHLYRDPALSTAVLRIFLEEIEQALRRAAGTRLRAGREFALNKNFERLSQAP